MRNMPSASVTHRVTVVSKPGLVDRWGAIPILCWLAVVGMPLQRNLDISQQLTMSDVYAATLGAEESSMKSVPFIFFLAAIYLCSALMLMRKPKPALSIILRQWPLLLLLLFVTASILWSPYREKVAVVLVHNLGALLVALAAAMRYRTAPWLLPKHVGYVLGLNIVVHLASIIFLPAYSIEWEGRWRGLTGQANELGGIAFSAFWANAAVVIGTKNDKYRVHFVLAICAAVAMLGANSMTSIISSLCAFALIYAIVTGSRYGVEERVFIGLGIVVLAAAVGLMFQSNAVDTGKLLGMAGRSSELTGRTDIWKGAFKAIASSPWVGWGFDDNAYLIKTTGMPYAHYHNGYLDLMVRGGVLALGLFFVLVGHWFYQMTMRTRLGIDIVPFAIPFIVSLLFYNMTEVNLVAPRNLMWLILLTMLFLSGCKKKKRQLPLIEHYQSRTRQTRSSGFKSPTYVHSAHE